MLPRKWPRSHLRLISIWCVSTFSLGKAEWDMNDVLNITDGLEGDDVELPDLFDPEETIRVLVPQTLDRILSPISDQAMLPWKLRSGIADEKATRAMYRKNDSGRTSLSKKPGTRQVVFRANLIRGG